MTNLRYRRGAALERLVKKRLESRDYYVQRSAKSGGAADLIAIKLKRGPFQETLVWFIQCKRRDRPDDLRIIKKRGEVTMIARSARVNALWVTLRKHKTIVQVLSCDASPNDTHEIIDLIEKPQK